MRVFIHPRRPAWLVIEEGRSHGLERLWLAEAIELAQRWVRGAGYGEVLVCDHDGRVEHRLSYPFTNRDKAHALLRVIRNVGKVLR